MSKDILLMPFVDESSSFTNGFECGQIWEEMTQGKEFSKRLVHTENIEQINLMADHFGYVIEVETNCDCWSYITGQPIDISFLHKSS